MIRLTVPSIKGVDAKTFRGFIAQLAHPSVAVEGTLTKFKVPSRAGWRLSAPQCSTTVQHLALTKLSSFDREILTLTIIGAPQSG